MYKVVTHKTLLGLQEKVTQHLESGHKIHGIRHWNWKVHGNLFFHGDSYIQVLLKEGCSSCYPDLKDSIDSIRRRLEGIQSNTRNLS